MIVSELTSEQLEKVLSSPFVTSWAGRALPGGRDASDPSRVAQGWAAWALTSFRSVSTPRRDYLALNLEGSVLRSGSRGQTAHLELPRKLWQVEDPLFPDRLAACRGALSFPTLLFDEVAALRRSLTACPTAVEPVVSGEDLSRLREGLANMTRAVAPHLGRLALSLDPAPLSNLLAGQQPQELLSRLSARAAGWKVSVEPGLEAASRTSLARRLLIWDVDTGSGRFSAASPRLTLSSSLSDPLFAPATATFAEALVRMVLLSRAAELLGLDLSAAVPPAREPAGSLRVLPAREGRRTARASDEAAVLFVSQVPSVQSAWEAIVAAAGTSWRPMVSKEQFEAAHDQVSAAVRRAAPVPRAAVDRLLPLVVSADGSVARITFARGRSS